jgi:hypothetical protein
MAERPKHVVDNLQYIHTEAVRTEVNTVGIMQHNIAVILKWGFTI